jgi:excisionase family DNA binding protein
MEDLLTYAQASRHLNLKLGTLYALVSQGRVPHVRLGRRLVRFSRTSLDAWLREHAVDPTSAQLTAHGEPRSAL